MRHHITAACLLTAGILLTGCSPSSGGDPQADDTTAPSPTPSTLCSGITWPHKIPSVVGTDFSASVTGKLLCYNVVKATAPDGHNALDDTSTTIVPWTISRITPAAGTAITETTPITLVLTEPR